MSLGTEPKEEGDKPITWKQGYFYKEDKSEHLHNSWAMFPAQSQHDRLSHVK